MNLRVKLRVPKCTPRVETRITRRVSSDFLAYVYMWTYHTHLPIVNMSKMHELVYVFEVDCCMKQWSSSRPVGDSVQLYNCPSSFCQLSALHLTMWSSNTREAWTPLREQMGAPPRRLNYKWTSHNLRR